MKLLLLSNGHGEDEVAVAIARHLAGPEAELAALPLVGAGRAYEALGLPILGPRRELASGGFVWGRPKALLRDLRQGYVGDLAERWQAAQAWKPKLLAFPQHPPPAAVLAVGDVVPLAWAWRLGLPFVFMGAFKSLRYGGGFSAQYGAVERWLLRQKQCRGVFVRDPESAEALHQQGVSLAQCQGNPMADALAGLSPHWGEGGPVLLLPGSRVPEALNHLARWLRVVEALAQQGVGPFRLAVAPHLPLGHQLPLGWQLEDGGALKGPQGLKVACGGLREMADGAALALASAGTATEQVTGMGLPAVVMAGPGPQFTPAFARAQTKLLAGAIRLARHEEEAVALALAWWREPLARQAAGQQGQRLMGESGAGWRLAVQLQKALGARALMRP